MPIGKAYPPLRDQIDLLHLMSRNINIFRIQGSMFPQVWCKKTFTEERAKPLGDMTLAEEKAISVLQHLVEGCSVRATSRITEVHPRTILNLPSLAGERCQRLMDERIHGLHVERQNLTMRMQMRRLTRLTNAFSKKWDKLHAMLVLYFAWYNFVRVHQTLRVTPAMEAGITDHIWTIEEFVLTSVYNPTALPNHAR